MDTIERLVLHILDEGGRTDVCGDHAFFDQHMRFVAGIWLHTGDFPLLIEEEVHLGTLNLKDAALIARML